MPELPEVETVRLGLLRLLGAQAVIRRVAVTRRDLRQPVPAGMERRLRDQPISSIARRGKVLLWHCGPGVLISHLGMTGSWRVADGPARAHDHCHIHLADGRTLVYHDPRRFGLLDWCPAECLADHPQLCRLGPEPLSEDFRPVDLARACAGRRGPIKSLLLDGRAVAGIGNIYAVEALFRAGIRPQAAAGSLSAARVARLHAALRAVLSEALASGGSSIRDYVDAQGLSGRFQHAFAVYDRAGLACRRCGRSLLGEALAGRQTVWCQSCQR